MNRLRLNAVSPTRDDAMSGQKSPRKKALTRTVRIAPALGVSTLAVLLILSLGPDRSHGQTIGDTQITLSCNDGHSVIFEVDQITLTSLLADVQAINASATGTSCTLTMAAIDPSNETTEWTVYDYNPSNQAIAPRNSPNSMPATTTGTTTTFQFKAGIYTALLTTFFFQAEDGIRDLTVTGVQTCALPISVAAQRHGHRSPRRPADQISRQER